MIFNRIKGKVKSLFVPEWCCAVRFNDSSDVYLIDNVCNEFTAIKDSYRYWTADPFLFRKDDKYYLFFEMFDRLKRKGLLGCREISNNGAGKMHVIYEGESHLSYPFIFEDNGGYYIIPESSESGELFVLKCTDFPYKWEKERVLAKKCLVDTTLLNYSNQTFYISERSFGNGVFDRIDLFYDDNGTFKECPSNPVKIDVNTARCAGKFFEYDNKIIRPSQDCGKFYGEKLNFNEVIGVSRELYEERLLKTIAVSDIKLNQKNDFIGIHTYNRLDNIEVIDLKISDNFNILNIIGALIKRIKKVISK
ncbi:MAG: hypothetical protein ACI4RF_08080 [Eubacterium sp.]